MNTTEKFLARIDADVTAFCKKKQMTESRFGREVAKNTELMRRIRARKASIETLLRVSQYMVEHSR